MKRDLNDELVHFQEIFKLNDLHLPFFLQVEV